MIFLLLSSQKWAGCGDNTEFAYGFAREFVDAKERDNASPKSKRERGRKEMNLHNNEAGRMVSFPDVNADVTCLPATLSTVRDVTYALVSRQQQQQETGGSVAGIFLICVSVFEL